MTSSSQQSHGTILIVALAVSLTATGAVLAGASAGNSGSLSTQPADSVSTQTADGSDQSLQSGGSTTVDGTNETSAVPADDQSTDEPDVVIQNVGYEGQGIVRIASEGTYLLADEPHRLETTIEAGQWSGDAEVCAWIVDEDDQSEPQSVTCESLDTLEEDSVTSATLDFDSWPGNETGWNTVHVAVVGDPDGLRPILDESTMDVRVLPKDEDVSASGLTTEQELVHGTNFLRADTDGDGLTDGQEIREVGTDPLTRDTAGNGVPDGMEVMLGTDPNDPWTPHLYLLVLAVPFGIGVIVLAAAAGRIERLGRRWESNRTGRSADGLGETESTSSAPSDRGQTDFGSGRWPAAGSPDGSDQFITDEERVVRLLEQNDGRMPQSELVEETDWSKSKVSRLLSQMEDDGTITKIPIGRTNLVGLGGREEFTSPVLGGEA